MAVKLPKHYVRHYEDLAVFRTFRVTNPNENVSVKNNVLGILHRDKNAFNMCLAIVMRYFSFYRRLFTQEEQHRNPRHGGKSR